MRIPLFYIPKTSFKKFLVIEKRYKCKRAIIPLGCDCHPAHTLQKLNIRKTSLPFDWLNNDPIKSLLFVSENLDNNFNDFLDNLYRNSRGYIVSERFPYAEFIHEDNLIENNLDRKKFLRRIERFKKLLKEEVYFLYNITSESLDSKKNVYDFYNSVLNFISKLNANHTLCIYIRYDESLNENENYCEMLLKLLREIKNVKIATYIRYRDQEGIWGDAKYYISLYTLLGIKVSMTFPKIYLK